MPSPSSISSYSTSSSGSSSSSRSVYHASLVDPSHHSPTLLILLHEEINEIIIGYAVQKVVETVNHAMQFQVTAHSIAKFATFATNVIRRAEVTMPVILSALVYVERAKENIQIDVEDWAMERVFLGAIITAAKYLNDATFKNIHWSVATKIFGKADVGRIERDFLAILDWELGITEDQLLFAAGEEPALGGNASAPIDVGEDYDIDSNINEDDENFLSPPPSPSPLEPTTVSGTPCRTYLPRMEKEPFEVSSFPPTIAATRPIKTLRQRQHKSCSRRHFSTRLYLKRQHSLDAVLRLLRPGRANSHALKKRSFLFACNCY